MNGCESYPGGTIFRMCEWSGRWVREDGRVKGELRRLHIFKRKDENVGSGASQISCFPENKT